MRKAVVDKQGEICYIMTKKQIFFKIVLFQVITKELRQKRGPEECRFFDEKSPHFADFCVM